MGKEDENKLIGFACAYTPLPLIDAAGFVPYRVLPIGDAPDRAGSLLHDNLCPHVKRILDRALASDLPELAGIVFVNSCDAMRRLSDAWGTARPDDRRILLDLPPHATQPAVDYLTKELHELSKTLAEWGGGFPREDEITHSIERYGELADRLQELAGRTALGVLSGGFAALQEMYNLSVTETLDRSMDSLDRLLAEAQATSANPNGRVPIFLFGNVMPDPRAFSLLEECGASVVGDDLCTASRMHVKLQLEGGGDTMKKLARGILARPRCARMLDSDHPGQLTEQVLQRAREHGAHGVIAHVVKFCDPYLSRLPAVRDKLREAGLPLLILEGDCTTRSLEQHRTRIEAFVEMLR